MSIKLYHPAPGSIPTDAFGYRPAIPGVVGAQLHTGQDYAGAAGTPILAAHSGRVSRIWFDVFPDGSPAGGNMVKIGAANFSTRYAHLESFTVAAGDHVKAGDIIGVMGATGAATGRHLHFELELPGGNFVDPVPYISSTPNGDKKMTAYRILNMRETKTGGAVTPRLFFDGGSGVGIKHIGSQADLALLRRFIADKPGEVFLTVEIDIINTYLRP